MHLGPFEEGIQILLVQKGGQPRDCLQVERLPVLLIVQAVVHQPGHVGGGQERGHLLDFLYGDGLRVRLGDLFLFYDPAQRPGSAVRAQELIHADFQDLAELLQLADVRAGAAPLPIRDGLIADLHGVRQVHLGHVPGNPGLFDFPCYFHGIEHNLSPFLLRAFRG